MRIEPALLPIVRINGSQKEGAISRRDACRRVAFDDLSFFAELLYSAAWAVIRVR